jgi:hypothetical protein
LKTLNFEDVSYITLGEHHSGVLPVFKSERNSHIAKAGAGANARSQKRYVRIVCNIVPLIGVCVCFTVACKFVSSLAN